MNYEVEGIYDLERLLEATPPRTYRILGYCISGYVALGGETSKGLGRATFSDL